MDVHFSLPRDADMAQECDREKGQVRSSPAVIRWGRAADQTDDSFRIISKTGNAVVDHPTVPGGEDQPGPAAAVRLGSVRSVLAVWRSQASVPELQARRHEVHRVL